VRRPRGLLCGATGDWSAAGTCQASLAPTAQQRQAQTLPAVCCRPQADDGFKWTTKYLKSSEQLRGVVTTLVELMHLPPHAALHRGRVTLTLTSACEHDRVSQLIGCGDRASCRMQVRAGGRLGSSSGRRQGHASFPMKLMGSCQPGLDWQVGAVDQHSPPATGGGWAAPAGGAGEGSRLEL